MHHDGEKNLLSCRELLIVAFQASPEDAEDLNTPESQLTCSGIGELFCVQAYFIYFKYPILCKARRDAIIWELLVMGIFQTFVKVERNKNPSVPVTPPQQLSTESHRVLSPPSVLRIYYLFKNPF